MTVACVACDGLRQSVRELRIADLRIADLRIAVLRIADGAGCA